MYAVESVLGGMYSTLNGVKEGKGVLELTYNCLKVDKSETGSGITFYKFFWEKWNSSAANSL